jgi:MFS family permease
MAVAMSLIGMAHNVVELVALRLLAGLLGGYASGCMALIAAQTPTERAGWALGVVATGNMAGNLAGPLIGGTLPPFIGIRATFLLAGGVIFVTFLATVFLIREERRRQPAPSKKTGGHWAQIPQKRPVLVMLATGFLLMLANMSIEPIITVYVAQLVPQAHVIFVSGLVMAASALGAVVSSSRLGHLADRIGYRPVISACLGAAAILLIPQAFVTAGWQLILLRFLMGLALGGLVPCIAAVIRHIVPQEMLSGALGYSISSQYAGQVLGPLSGGFIGGHIGMSAVFLITSGLMGVGAAANWLFARPA